MLRKIFSTSLFFAIIATLMSVSSSNAQDMGKSRMMKEHNKMKSEMADVDIMKVDANGDGKIFACPMGCEVKDEAGECSVCGMDLKEMSVEDAEKIMEENHHKMMKDKEHMDGMMGEQMGERKSHCSKASEECSTPCTTDNKGMTSNMEVK